MDIVEGLPDPEPVAQLSRHQFFLVACPHDLTVLDPPDLLGMLVGDLSAPYNAYLNH
jgi:hypothetical protein